jgi:hypothetical protein
VVHCADIEFKAGFWTRALTRRSNLPGMALAAFGALVGVRE